MTVIIIIECVDWVNPLIFSYKLLLPIYTKQIVVNIAKLKILPNSLTDVKSADASGKSSVDISVKTNLPFGDENIPWPNPRKIKAIVIYFNTCLITFNLLISYFNNY